MEPATVTAFTLRHLLLKWKIDNKQRLFFCSDNFCLKKKKKMNEEEVMRLAAIGLGVFAALAVNPRARELLRPTNHRTLARTLEKSMTEIAEQTKDKKSKKEIVVECPVCMEEKVASLFTPTDCCNKAICDACAKKISPCPFCRGKMS
jgi:hypothetical protein